MTTLTYRNEANQEVILNKFPELSKLINRLNNHIVSRRNNLEWLIFKEPVNGDFYSQFRRTEFETLAQVFSEEGYKVIAVSKHDNKVHLVSVFLQEYIQLNHSHDAEPNVTRYYEPYQFDSYLIGIGAWDVSLMSKSKDTPIKGIGFLLLKLAKECIEVVTATPFAPRLQELVRELGFTEIPIYKPDLQTKRERLMSIPTMISNKKVLTNFTKAPMVGRVGLGDRMPPLLKTKILEQGNIPAIIKSFKVNEQLLLKLPKGLRLADELYVGFTPDNNVELHLPNKSFCFPLDLINTIINATTGLLRVSGGYEDKIFEKYDLEKYGFKKFYSVESFTNYKQDKRGVNTNNVPEQNLTRQQKRRLEREESKKANK